MKLHWNSLVTCDKMFLPVIYTKTILILRMIKRMALMKFNGISDLIRRIKGGSLVPTTRQSEPTQSTIFIQPVPGTESSYADMDVSGMSVLVIEDNIFILDTVASYLRNRGISVETVKNGTLGIESFLHHPEFFDAVFVDIKIPGIDGIEVAKMIRASDAPNAKKIPLVAVSGEIPRTDIDNAIFDFFLKKPFAMEVLLTTLQKCALHSKR